MGEMVVGVSNISDIVINIAEAAEEQATGLAQIASSVDRLNEVTQQNTNMAQNATMITTDLDSETAHMNDILMTFRLGMSGPFGNEDVTDTSGSDYWQVAQARRSAP